MAECLVPGIVGLLLASGRGTRFDPSGQRNKLLASLPDGRLVIRASAQALCACLSRVIVIVREDSRAVESAISGLPLEIVENPHAGLGMGTSIATGVRFTPDAPGWLVALGDMPFIAPATIAAIAAPLLAHPHAIVAPVHRDVRGHPVGFGRAHQAALMRLTGEEGARALLKAHPVTLVAVSDSGILRDIDTPSDLSETNG